MKQFAGQRLTLILIIATALLFAGSLWNLAAARAVMRDRANLRKILDLDIQDALAKQGSSEAHVEAMTQYLETTRENLRLLTEKARFADLDRDKAGNAAEYDIVIASKKKNLASLASKKRARLNQAALAFPAGSDKFQDNLRAASVLEWLASRALEAGAAEISAGSCPGAQNIGPHSQITTIPAQVSAQGTMPNFIRMLRLLRQDGACLEISSFVIEPTDIKKTKSVGAPLSMTVSAAALRISASAPAETAAPASAPAQPGVPPLPGGIPNSGMPPFPPPPGGSR